MGIGFLGPLQIEGAAASLSPRDRAVLAALAVHPGEVMTSDRLADALWGEEPPASWSKVVHGCVMRLRKAMGPGAIETAAGGYRLAVTGDDLDIQRFEAMVERGRELAATGAPERAASTLARALSLWRGAPFEDLDGWAPARSEAARLEELRRSAEEDLLDDRLASGEHRQVAAEGEARVGEEPLRERRWATLALAQYRCGRQADALRSLQRARRTLVDQLGIDPGPDLVALESAILRQDPDLAGQREPLAISPLCPYQGLAPYDVADRDRFFGRDAEIGACLERLAASPLLVVAGPSGCGKSSLVRAGLVPALQRRGRTVVVFAPGSDPDAALTNALASAADAAVVVVDQLEELFTLDDNADTARAFCARLAVYATGQAPVVAAVRVDHLAGLAADSAFARLAEQGLHLVSPLTGDALRAAIEGPAVQAGLRLEPGLVDLLVRDTEGEPGALPLLSHALAQTWERRDGRVLTVEGYRATGGIRGAVARSADRLYESLPPDQRSVLRSVLLRLVAPSPDGEPVRSRIPTDTLGGDTARERVVRLLVRARLVTAEADTVELAHEALARAWPRLRSWLDEDAAGQRIFHHLAAAAAGWESLGRPDSELYRGARLEAAVEWRDAAEPDLTALEATFLDTSAAQAASDHEALVQRSRHQARQNRRLRGLLTTTAVLLVVALLAGAVAVQRGRETGRQRDAAAFEALVNRSLALRPSDRATAALLAVEAYRRAPDDPRAHSALLGTFTAEPGFMGYQHLPADNVFAGAPVPGTSTAVVAVDGRDLELVDLESGEVDDRFLTTDVTPTAADALRPSVLRMSADGRFVVHLTTTESSQPCFDPQDSLATDDRPCVAFSVYEIASGRRVLGPITPSFGAGNVAINGDGSLVAVAGGYDGELAIYRTADGALLGTVAGLPRPDDARLTEFLWGGHRRNTAAVVFGPDGAIYVGSLQGAVRVVDPGTAQVVRTFDAPVMSSHVNLALTPDGLLVGTGRAAIVAVETSTGATRWSADIYYETGVDPYPCLAFAIAPEAGRLYCGNAWGQLHERDLATGLPTGVSFDTQLGLASDLAIASDGRELVAFGRVPVISRWRLDGSGAVVDHIAEGRVSIGGYDPTGEMLLVYRRESIAGLPQPGSEFDPAVWDPVSDAAIDELPGSIGALWFGRDLLGGYFDGGNGLYDVSARAPVPSIERIPLPNFQWLWMSPEGDRTYGSVVEGDPETGPRCEIHTYDPVRRERIEPTIELEGDGDCSMETSVSGTRDGRRVVVTTGGGSYITRETTVHDGQTGEQLAGPLRGAIATSVSPDGVLVGGDASGAITQYDLDTLEPVGTFPGTRAGVTQLRFSADGQILVAVSWNQTLSIYDVATRTRLGDPIDNDVPFTASLRPDGKVVATSTPDGVAIWDIDPEHLADAACQLAGRNLTPTEWDTYLGTEGDRRATCPNYD